MATRSHSRRRIKLEGAAVPLLPCAQPGAASIQPPLPEPRVPRAPRPRPLVQSPNRFPEGSPSMAHAHTSTRMHTPTGAISLETLINTPSLQPWLAEAAPIQLSTDRWEKAWVAPIPLSGVLRERPTKKP